MTHMRRAEVVRSPTQNLMTQLHEKPIRRSSRTRRPTQKIRDAHPEGPGSFESADPPSSPPRSPRRIQRVILHVTEKVRTLANRFGLSRTYSGRPSAVPDENVPVSQRYVPDAAHVAADTAQPLSVPEVISPYPNLSSWRMGYNHYCRGAIKSQADQTRFVQEVLLQEDFEKKDLVGVDLAGLANRLSNADTSLPWQSGGGWKESSVTIGIPSGAKTTQSSRRANASAAAATACGETLPDTPAEIDVQGVHFDIPGLHHRSIPQVIRDTWSSNSAFKQFHLHPFVQTWERPDDHGGEPIHERVYDELYNTDAWVEEDKKIQHLPPEPGCTRARVIAGLLLASDSTNPAQFGQGKLWPEYMFFGNQSKYTRCRPSAKAAHHIAYIPSVCAVYV